MNITKLSLDGNQIVISLDTDVSKLDGMQIARVVHSIPDYIFENVEDIKHDKATTDDIIIGLIQVEHEYVDNVITEYLDKIEQISNENFDKSPEKPVIEKFPNEFDIYKNSDRVAVPSLLGLKNVSSLVNNLMSPGH